MEDRPALFRRCSFVRARPGHNIARSEARLSLARKHTIRRLEGRKLIYLDSEVVQLAEAPQRIVDEEARC